MTILTLGADPVSDLSQISWHATVGRAAHAITGGSLLHPALCGRSLPTGPDGPVLRRCQRCDLVVSKLIDAALAAVVDATPLEQARADAAITTGIATTHQDSYAAMHLRGDVGRAQAAVARGRDPELFVDLVTRVRAVRERKVAARWALNAAGDLDDNTLVDGSGRACGFLMRGVNGKWFALPISRISWADPIQGLDNVDSHGWLSPAEAASDFMAEQ